MCLLTHSRARARARARSAQWSETGTGTDRTDDAARAIVEKELVTLNPDDLVLVGDCPTGVDAAVLDVMDRVWCSCIVFLAGEPTARSERGGE